jgi:NAD(P)-dependent dehydrogenase (short-subunit alcohol dehydrogenase family)
MTCTAIITGSCGGVGRGIVAAFRAAGWHTIGIDRPGLTGAGCEVEVEFDLRRLAEAESAASELAAHVRRAAQGGSISCLVNNAAVQRLAPTEAMTLDELQETFGVNVLATMRLTQALLPDLAACAGSVVNLSSVHATATKPGFVAYATSKAAISGMTRAMAVDLGGRIRVNAIELAATDTPMLAAGFEGRPEAFRELARCHPLGRIASPLEVGRVVVTLADPVISGFVTGCCLRVDGGVTSRLHDPL